jgi:hypothetical protein
MEPDSEVNADSQLSPAPVDPWPILEAEWFLVLLLDGGKVEHVVPVASRQEAETRGRALPGGMWGIRHRMVTPPTWVGVYRNHIAVTEVDPGLFRVKVTEVVPVDGDGSVAH